MPTAEPSEAEIAKARELIPPDQRPRRILDELTAARILRAAESERQLNEVMVDFWMNHFNVYANKGQDRFAIVSFERDTIRPHIWGRSRTCSRPRPSRPRCSSTWTTRARSRTRSTGAAFPAAVALRTANAPRGLNENYARELMELHTLGVDGGYTQKDVTELARILTGWSIGRPQGDGDAAGRVERAGRGRRMMQDAEPESPATSSSARARTTPGPRRCSGRPSPPAESREGERAIAMLAHHPATARHIAYQLCQRLVADEPPAGARRPGREAVPGQRRRPARHRPRDRDLARVLRPAVLPEPRSSRPSSTSSRRCGPSAASPTAGPSRGRSPRWASRSTSASRRPATPTPPTPGCPRARCSRGSTSRSRWRRAASPGTSADPGILRLAGSSPGRGVDAAAHWLIGTDISEETLATISKRIAEDERRPGRRRSSAGLLLGSPEFQRQ